LFAAFCQGAKLSPEDFAAQLKRDIEVAGRLVKAAKIEPTD
jgi:hypothetical protein